MSVADSLETLLAQRRRLDAAIARAHRVLARIPSFEVGDRVTLKIGADVLYATVAQLIPDHPSGPAAYIRIAGHSCWFHCAQLSELRRVCGVCSDCLAMNQQPECAS